MEIQKLQVGDLVRYKPDGIQGENFVVTASYGPRATAVRTVDITNPDEWILVSRVDRRAREGG